MFKPQISFRSADRSIARLPIESILPNPHQPREALSEASVDDLAQSIRRHGLISPITVRRREDGQYELVAGQRRLKALESLKRSYVDAIVVAADDCECALIALVENVQRENLHFLDEAGACRRILEQYPITQEKLAASLSCSPSALANRLRLLKLPERVKEEVRSKGLSERHARALLRIEGEDEQLRMAVLASDRRMSVKQLEAQIDRMQTKPDQKRKINPIVKDNRIVINAVMDTVRELSRIGVRVKSRIEESEDHVDVIVSIPAINRAAVPEKSNPCE